MAFDVQLVFSGVNEVLQFLSFLPSKWRLTTRRIMREWGPELTDQAESLSPSDKLRSTDRRRRPESERLAHRWAWDVTGISEPTLHVGNVDPKAPFILFPTKGGTTITPREKDYLLFFDTAGRPHRRFSVVKGATAGQPVHRWTLAAWDLDNRVRQLADGLVRR